MRNNLIFQHNIEYIMTNSRCREIWGVGSWQGHRMRSPSTDPSWSKWPCAGRGWRRWWRWWHGREPKVLCTWAPQWTVAQVQNTLGLPSVAAVLLLGPLQALKVGICRGGAGRYRCHSIEPWMGKYFLDIFRECWCRTSKIQSHIYLATSSILLVSSLTLPLRQEQNCKQRTGMRTKATSWEH